MPSKQSEWAGVAIPKAVAERIDRHLTIDKTYRSRGEVVKAAVLDWLKGHDDARGAA